MDFRSHTNYPRGMRNNNAGNFRPFNAYTYLGQVGVDGLGYAIFSDMSYGLRAMAKQILKDINVYGFNTPNKLIHSWAPASDPTANNDEVFYANYVANKMGIGSNSVIPTDRNSLRRLMRAMNEVEEGVSYSNMIPDSDIYAGIDMANGGAVPDTSNSSSTGSDTGLYVAAGAMILIGWALSRR